MAADQASGPAGKAQAVIARIGREVAWPGGRDIDWEKVQGVVAIIGAVTLIHGLRTRSWRYIHTATTVLAISTAVAGRLKDRYAGAPLVTETNDPDLYRSGGISTRTVTVSKADSAPNGQAKSPGSCRASHCRVRRS